MAYILDANVFIEAKNHHYGFDLVPGFWSWLDQARAAGSVVSIDAVGGELRAGGDDLSVWAAARPEFFPPLGSLEIACLPQVSVRANGGVFAPAAVSEFLSVADYYLVAAALGGKHVVVTHEKSSNGTRRIKIPNACTDLGVRCVTPFEMLRREGARFVLATAG